MSYAHENRAINKFFLKKRLSVINIKTQTGMLSGYFVDIRLKLNKRPKYYIPFEIIFFLTAVVCGENYGEIR